MTKSKEGFDKLENNQDCLYGPRKLILCGFSGEAQTKFKSLLNGLGLVDIPLVWAGSEQQDIMIEDIMKMADGSGEAMDSHLPRAIIAAGIQQRELHTLMGGCRQASMQPSLWAVLTSTSEKWPLIQLLSALAEESKAMAKARAGSKRP